MNYAKLFAMAGTAFNLMQLGIALSKDDQSWIPWATASMWSFICVIHEIRHEQDKNNNE